MLHFSGALCGRVLRFLGNRFAYVAVSALGLVLLWVHVQTTGELFSITPIPGAGSAYAPVFAQSLVILASVILLVVQHRRDRKRAHEDSKRRTQAASLEQIRHTTSQFRAMERRFLHPLILWAHSHREDSPLAKRWASYPEDEIKRMIVDAELAHLSRGGASDVDLEGEAKTFIEGLADPYRGIEQLTAGMAHVFNGCFATQSYLREMLTHYEQLGVGIHRDAFRFATIDRALGTQVVDAYIRWEMFILERRKRARHRHAFNQFQLLAALIVRHRALLEMSDLLSHVQRSFDHDLRHRDREIQIAYDIKAEKLLITDEASGATISPTLKRQDAWWFKQAGLDRFRFTDGGVRRAGEPLVENRIEPYDTSVCTTPDLAEILVEQPEELLFRALCIRLRGVGRCDDLHVPISCQPLLNAWDKQECSRPKHTVHPVSMDVSPGSGGGSLATPLSPASGDSSPDDPLDDASDVIWPVRRSESAKESKRS